MHLGYGLVVFRLTQLLLLLLLQQQFAIVGGQGRQQPVIHIVVEFVGGHGADGGGDIGGGGGGGGGSRGAGTTVPARLVDRNVGLFVMAFHVLEHNQPIRISANGNGAEEGRKICVERKDLLEFSRKLP